MSDKKDDENKIDYKKAFDMLMVMMIAKTLSPDEHNFGYGGGADTCLRCMEQGRNFAYGDDGDKKLVCDKCPNNLTNGGEKHGMERL